MRHMFFIQINGLNRSWTSKVLIELFFLLCPMTSFASTHLVLFLTSGSCITIPITEQPKISFEGSIITVESISYQMDNVQKWMVGDPETVGIENVIIITPKKKNAQARVYNAAGVEVAARRVVEKDGRLQFDLRGLPAGVYVIQIGNETLKVTKR